jgi:hypothetical protein
MANHLQGMIMKKFEYEVIAHIEDEDDIVEVCDERDMIDWVNAFRDEDEITGLTINKVLSI